MNALRYSNPQRYARSETFDLKFSFHSHLGGDGQYIYDVALKVEHGVKFLSELWPERPTEALMARRCAQYGRYSSRPYVAGQVTDVSTGDCVLALYHHCCRSYAIDPTGLLIRTYPDKESPMRWTHDAWHRVLQSADWHGTAMPKCWGGDAVIGLLLSLTGQDRGALAETLTQELLLRLPETEPGAPS
jgi:hypothetical protein